MIRVPCPNRVLWIMHQYYDVVVIWSWNISIPPFLLDANICILNINSKSFSCLKCRWWLYSLCISVFYIVYLAKNIKLMKWILFVEKCFDVVLFCIWKKSQVQRSDESWCRRRNAMRSQQELVFFRTNIERSTVMRCEPVEWRTFCSSRVYVYACLERHTPHLRSGSHRITVHGWIFEIY